MSVGDITGLKEKCYAYFQQLVLVADENKILVSAFTGLTWQLLEI